MMPIDRLQSLPADALKVDKLKTFVLSQAIAFPPKDPFTVLMSQQGTVYRQIKNRRTLSFEEKNRYFFMKQHRSIGWREFFKHVFALRWPTWGARTEYEALVRLNQEGLSVPRVHGFAETASCPIYQSSFLITEAVEYLCTLEDLAFAWTNAQLCFNEKQRLIHQVATFLKNCHERGINHRDFYACHILLKKDKAGLLEPVYIDWHRAQIRKKVPKRWRIKDLASLYYSVLNFNLSRGDLCRFMAFYEGSKGIEQRKFKSIFWYKVWKRTAFLVRRHQDFAKEPLPGKILASFDKKRYYFNDKC